MLCCRSMLGESGRSEPTQVPQHGAGVIAPGRHCDRFGWALPAIHVLLLFCASLAIGCSEKHSLPTDSGVSDGSSEALVDGSFHMPAPAECPDGLQDNDGDGDCLPTCDSAGLRCEAHATCDDARGTAGCTCQAEYQDNDDDGTCLPGCALADCGRNTSCDDTGGAAVCDCKKGFQDNDGDGDCRVQCDASTCGATEHCDDASGAAECLCNKGYVGSACDNCDVGFQDRDANGTCERACGTAAESCSDRGACDDGSGLIVCDCDPGYHGDRCATCAAGYLDDGSGACVWAGVVQDSGFSGTGWTAHAGATTGGGWAEFPSIAVCFGGSVSQTVIVPAYDETVPLVLRFQTRRADNMAQPPHPAVSINGVMRRADLDWNSSGWVESSVCLGEADYGGEVEISFMAFDVPSQCDVDPFHIDNARIEPADPDECPTPQNPIPNGDFSASTGWVKDSSGGSVSFANDELTINGSVCDDVLAVGQAWIPATGTSPPLALELTTNGAIGSHLVVRLNDRAIGSIEGMAGAMTNRVCIPTWARGAAVTLGFLVDGLGGLCADLVSFTVDDLQLVDAPECPDGEPLFQGGFESFNDAALLSPWVPDRYTNGKNPESSVALVQNPTTAFAGDGALRLETPFICQRASATQSVSVPIPTGADGPALIYAYRYPVPNMGLPKADVCIDGDCQPLTPTDTWSTALLCIDPILAGRQLEVGLRLDGGSGSCSAEYSPHQDLWFDDMDLVLDPGCPAQ